MSMDRTPVEAHIPENRPTDDVERFLSSVRFESKGKLAELGVKIGKNLLNRTFTGSSPRRGFQSTQILSEMLVFIPKIGHNE